MRHSYDRAFFDWVRMTALEAAQTVVPLVVEAACPASVIDVGCGEGAWLSVWQTRGVADVAGLDGSYVDTGALMIPPGRFAAIDLSQPFAADRRFDLVQSLEVAEHLPPASSEAFVTSLCRLGDIVLFSAAQPGQGGDNHVNERLPSFWAGLFREQGYAAFDCLRPALRDRTAVAPWYRYNTIIYANTAGQRRLSASARSMRCLHLPDLDASGGAAWRLRRLVLRPLPVPVVTWLSRMRYRVENARRRRGGLARQA